MESRRKLTFVVCVFVLNVSWLACTANADTLRIDLAGPWTVMNDNTNGTKYTVHGMVPGNMYTALLANHKIGDPYYMYNDDEYRWIPRENWTYQRTFQVASDVLQKDRVILVCEGLDTISIIRINGVIIGQSYNMFVRYDFDIKPALKTGTNEIRVEFMSAIAYVDQKAKEVRYPIPPECPPPGQHGECHVNMIRKEQCSFSWDWGPSFPTQGIWKNISIQAFDSATIEYLTAETLQGTGATAWILAMNVVFEVSTGKTVSGNLELRLAGTSVRTVLHVNLTASTKQKVSYSFNIPATENIEAWWPNGYGAQRLYDLEAIFTSTGGGELSDKTTRIGFRTVELVQDPIPNAQGLTYYFKINGMPIFMKGSNWIPADSFQDRVTEARYRNLLESAADANMNCVRVWGGGIYESYEFYDIADELGIMIWQDCMYACAMYSADGFFLELVQEEITHQIRRLKSHPSILLWAGNNENEKALAQNWYGTSSNFSLYKKDYIKLYIDTIGATVQAEDSSRPFISSSPSNGEESEQEGWVAKNPDDLHYGDEHFYDYVHDLWKVSNFPIQRFGSEYGLQSWSSLETLSKVADESVWDYSSAWCAHRQHHPAGNIEMLAEIQFHFNLTYNPDTKQRFDDTIYLTQINQAMGIRFESEHNRRWQSQVVNSYGMTMGALYWQLNDIWQGPTWASLEYGGKWKMLHYYAKQFFAPKLISPYTESDTLKVYIVLDKPPHVGSLSVPVTSKTHFHEQHTGIVGLRKHQVSHIVHLDQQMAAPAAEETLYVQMYSWSKMTPLHTWTQTFTMNTSSELVFQASVLEMMSTAGCPSINDCVLYFHSDDENTNNWLPLSSFRGASIPTVNISVISVKQNPQSSMEFTISMSTNQIAPFVWLEAIGVAGRFSDNGFLMVKPTMTISFYAWQTINVATLSKSLKIRSLTDIYNY